MYSVRETSHIFLLILQKTIVQEILRVITQIPNQFVKLCAIVFSSNQHSVSYFYSIMHTPFSIRKLLTINPYLYLGNMYEICYYISYFVLE